MVHQVLDRHRWEEVGDVCLDEKGVASRDHPKLVLPRRGKGTGLGFRCQVRKLADLAILSADLRALPVKELRDLPVSMTVGAVRWCGRAEGASLKHLDLSELRVD